MKNYRSRFKIYLDDLGRRKPSPGGGSVVCLIFCLGVSLIEKAINYSFADQPKIPKQVSRNKRFKKQVAALQKLRKRIYPYIDKDAYIFEKVICSQGQKRTEFIRESEKIILQVARDSKRAFFLAKAVESGIKKSILSDFYLGLGLLNLALRGCIFNWEANQRMFGRSSKYRSTFKKFFKKWGKY